MSGGEWFLCSNRLSRYASLSTPCATAADMPLSYMVASEQPRDRCRFTDLSSPLQFDIDLSVPLADLADYGISSWRVLSLLYNNSSINGVWSVVGADSFDSIASPTYESDPRSLWPSPDCWQYPRIHSTIYEPLGVTESCLRVTIDDPTPRRLAQTPSGFAVADYFEIGCLRVEYGIAPSDTSQVQSSIAGGSLALGLDQESRIVTSEGGGDFPRFRPIKDVKSFMLRFTGPQARQECERTILDLRREVGTSKSVLMFEDLNSDQGQMDKTIYGRLTGLDDVSVPTHERYEVIIRLVQML